eukprot:7384099-Prymnesium_polylepis.2
MHDCLSSSASWHSTGRVPEPGAPGDSCQRSIWHRDAVLDIAAGERACKYRALPPLGQEAILYVNGGHLWRLANGMGHIQRPCFVHERQVEAYLLHSRPSTRIPALEVALATVASVHDSARCAHPKVGCEANVCWDGTDRERLLLDRCVRLFLGRCSRHLWNGLLQHAGRTGQWANAKPKVRCGKDHLGREPDGQA